MVLLASSSSTEAPALLGDNQQVVDGERKESVLFLTAHPDDECMFFAPTLLALAPYADSMCYGRLAGNAEGLGRVREKELVASCIQLGLNPALVSSMNHEQLQDSMSAIWDTQVILSVVQQYMSQHTIDAIITFDAKGISGHTNHRALYHAINAAVRSNAITVPCYALKTVPWYRKFSSIIDLAVTFATDSLIFGSIAVTSTRERRLFVSYPSQYLAARNAMFQHKSQMVWFRHLYLAFSRYMIFNVLKLIEAQPPEY
ncbi:putative deacetylase LmbE-like domain-containing protein [Entophlyctis helioformis]|nr:putative deacetylase LmbE-like domain-containing protein [Entophlyctis helioformis]